MKPIIKSGNEFNNAVTINSTIVGIGDGTTTGAIASMNQQLGNTIGLPDYDNTLVSSIPNNYVSTVKGWLVGTIGAYGQAMGISINGKRVAYTNNSASTNSYASVQTPISIGDVVTFTGTPSTNELEIVAEVS